MFYCKKRNIEIAVGGGEDREVISFVNQNYWLFPFLRVLWLLKCFVSDSKECLQAPENFHPIQNDEEKLQVENFLGC